MTTSSSENGAAAAIRTAAEKALGAAWGGTARLAPGETVHGASPRSSVSRWRVLDGPSGASASVIVKRAVTQDHETFDPKLASGGPAWRLFNEWAGLQFLDEVFDGQPPAPRLYAGDRMAGLLIMEDLGAGDSLVTPLLGNDAVVAEDALIQLMTVLGRIHACTVGRQDDYSRVRAVLGPTTPYFSPAAEDILPPERIATIFRSAAEVVGISPARGVDADLAAVTSFWTDPGPFLAYTHGDPAPGNEMRHAAARKLVDFEFGGVRHALTEGVYARMQFVTGECVNRLPDPVARRMETAYRAELLQGCPEAGDDTLFFHAMAEACAYATICMLSWAMPGVLETDEDWGLATYRQRLLRRLDIVAQTATEVGYLEAIGTTAAMMAAKLRTLWPPEADAIPYYPAFRMDCYSL